MTDLDLQENDENRYSSDPLHPLHLAEAPTLDSAVDAVNDALGQTIDRLKKLRAEKEALRLEIKRTVRAVELLERMARVTK